MLNISTYFFRSAILFLIAGIAIGIHMSVSQSHDVIGAHAHINLLGWVTSAIFGGYYALNPAKSEGLLPLVQYWLYTLGVVVMGISLYLLLKGNVALEPVVAASSLVTFAGVLIFAWIVWMPSSARTA
ncbi:hypothetical protein [Devosia sp. SL43]|uniref:hypothetical protein n=1 Tax=Devosia sp. SL43 TaxID=2806348 RepID=UPI001F356303|nr:hypothetical protein [Devosia sp. SL43]UJW86813.1 hypothetical protein IM737_06060 [Devosia sp. SL43]